MCRVSTKENPVILDGDKTYLEQMEEAALDNPEDREYLQAVYRNADLMSCLSDIPMLSMDGPSAPPSARPAND